MSDPIFLNLLACFGVSVNVAGQVYPRVDASVQKEHFEKTLNQMYKEMSKLFKDDMEGAVTKDMFEAPENDAMADDE